MIENTSEVLKNRGDTKIFLVSNGRLLVPIRSRPHSFFSYFWKYNGDEDRRRRRQRRRPRRNGPNANRGHWNFFLLFFSFFCWAFKPIFVGEFLGPIRRYTDFFSSFYKINCLFVRQFFSSYVMFVGL